MIDLSNYFGDWTQVRVQAKNLSDDQKLWLKENVSIMGLKWDLHQEKLETRLVSLKKRPHTFILKFKDESSALLFLLKYGGEVVKNEQTI